MSAPRRRSWARRHAALLAAAAACVALAIDGGYQIYAARIQHRNEATATKVARLSKAQCSSTQLVYAFFNALAVDTSPAFGSPPHGPIIPGARGRLINRLYAAERQAAAPLRRQGCTLRVP